MAHGDEGVPHDDRERRAELHQDLRGMVAPQPAGGGDVVDVLAVTQIDDHVRVG